MWTLRNLFKVQADGYLYFKQEFSERRESWFTACHNWAQLPIHYFFWAMSSPHPSRKAEDGTQTPENTGSSLHLNWSSPLSPRRVSQRGFDQFQRQLHPPVPRAVSNRTARLQRTRRSRHLAMHRLFFTWKVWSLWKGAQREWVCVF